MKHDRTDLRFLLSLLLLLFTALILTPQQGNTQGFEKIYRVLPSMPVADKMGMGKLGNGEAIIFSNGNRVVHADVNGDSLGLDTLGYSTIGTFAGTARLANGGILALGTAFSMGYDHFAVTTFDPQGQQLGYDTIPLPGDAYGRGIATGPNGYIYYVGVMPNQIPQDYNDYVVVATDSLLNVRWYFRDTTSYYDWGTAVTVAANGDVITLSVGRDSNYIHPSIVTHRYTDTGSLLWETTLYSYYNTHAPRKIVEQANGDIAYVYESVDSSGGDTAATLVVLTPQGNIQSIFDNFGTANEWFPTTLDCTPDGGYVVGGFEYDLTTSPTTGHDVYLAKVDSGGNTVWDKTLIRPGGERLDDLQIEPDGSMYGVGEKRDFWSSVVIPFYLKTDSLGNSFSRYIHGNVYADFNSNCLFDSSDYGQSAWLVRANGIQDFYAMSDPNGDYFMDVDSGTYIMQMQPVGPYWETALCALPNTLVTLPLAYDTASVDLPAAPVVDCPYMVVDISAPFIRHCFPNTYLVQYKNEGTLPAYPTRVEVEIDTFMVVDSASVPWVTPQSGNLYVFELDTVDIGEAGSFRIFTHIPCPGDAVSGQNYCATAHVFPDSLCMDLNSIWDGSSIEILAYCDNNDSVRFEIQNVGAFNMTSTGGYSVLEDNLLSSQSTFSLSSGGSLPLAYPANGSTWTLQAEQSPGHPARSFPVRSVEGCGTNMGGSFSMGFVSAFPQDDGDPFTSIHCEPSRGAFDPNDKTGFPLGLGPDHEIRDGQRLEYRIRFQNTGNDTAFTVIVKDELSPLLDPSTLVIGPASHNFDFSIDGDGNMEWIFPQILLPDSNINEPESHGYLTFSIDADTGLAPGTRIENRAAIFFDFNEPILTNTTFHTLAEDLFVSIDPPLQTTTAHLRIFPHPVTESAVFDLGTQFRALNLEIYDLRGQRIRLESHTNCSSFEWNRERLPAGLYVYRLSTDTGDLFTGKIMIK